MVARILLIEDDVIHNEVTAELLRNLGFVSIAIAAVDDALAAMRRECPVLVICDPSGAAAKGLDLARQIKADPALHAIPLVAVTDAASLGEREKVLAAGFDGYITKPVDPDTFACNIKVYLHLQGRSASEHGGEAME